MFLHVLVAVRMYHDVKKHVSIMCVSWSVGSGNMSHASCFLYNDVKKHVPIMCVSWSIGQVSFRS